MNKQDLIGHNIREAKFHRCEMVVYFEKILCKQKEIRSIKKEVVYVNMQHSIGHNCPEAKFYRCKMVVYLTAKNFVMWIIRWLMHFMCRYLTCTPRWKRL